MHRILAAQAFKIRFPDVVLVQPRLADVDLIQRDRISVLARIDTDGCVHRVSSLLAEAALPSSPDRAATCCPLRQALRRTSDGGRFSMRSVRIACPCRPD